MSKYRKKPIVIEAIQWTGDNLDDICKKFPDFRLKYTISEDVLGIYTLEGVMWASKGDYIIQGIQDEFYPCKPDIFKETYEEVKDA